MAKAKFYELDLKHEFNPYNKTDRDMLERARNTLVDPHINLSQEAVADIYWFCVRYWLEKQAQQEIYEKHFEEYLAEKGDTQV
jgi:hypothetical protein